MKHLNIFFVPLLLTTSFSHSSELFLKIKQKAEQNPQIVKYAKIAALGAAVVYAFSLLKKTDEITAAIQHSSPAQTQTPDAPKSDSDDASDQLRTNGFDPNSIEPIGSPAGSMVIKQPSADQHVTSQLQAQTYSILTSPDVPVAIRQAMIQQGNGGVSKRKKKKEAKASVSESIATPDFEKTLAELTKQITAEQNVTERQKLATNLALDEINQKIIPGAPQEAVIQCRQTIEEMIKLGADKQTLAGQFNHQRKKIRMDVPQTESWANHAGKRKAHKTQCTYLDQISTILGIKINTEYWDHTNTPPQWGIATAAKTVSAESVDPHNLDQAKAFLSRIQRQSDERKS